MRRVIKAIRELDLSKYPVKEVSELLLKFGKVPYMITDYNYPKIIHRACPIGDDENVNTVSRLKYKPPESNDTYQRASTPNQTMFYGTVLPENPSEDLIRNARITGACETISFLRNPKIREGRKKVVYGKWIVKEEISLISVFFMKFRNAKNSWIKELAEVFYENISQFPYEEKKKYKTIVNYVAHEFSRIYYDENDYDYLIPATFTEMVLKNGYDGVLYPSVRTKRTGLSVAIKPEKVDSSMQLISVLECVVTKNGKKVLIDNLRYCDVEEGAESFELIKI